MRPIILVFMMLALPVLADVRVVDGDTLVIDNVTYRINGIDAPEHGQSCGNWGCGQDATGALADLVEGKDPQCQELGRDGYGRVIATCYVNGIDIGKALVQGGKAWAFLRYSDTYMNDELAAKAKGLGIWSGHYQTPWEFREERWNTEQQQAPNGCPIKGNISRNGRIYHTPWSPWYSRTHINTAKGERWFCSEDEAVKAGWRAPYWD